MERIIEDLSLDELADREYLTVRAVNACKSVKIKTLSDLIAFFEKDNIGFMRIRNCGVGTARMLAEVYNKYTKEKGKEKDEYEELGGKKIKKVLITLKTIEAKVNYVKNKIEFELAEKERLLKEYDRLMAKNIERREELQSIRNQNKALLEEIDTLKRKINARNRERIQLKGMNPNL